MQINLHWDVKSIEKRFSINMCVMFCINNASLKIRKTKSEFLADTFEEAFCHVSVALYDEKEQKKSNRRLHFIRS